MDRTSVFMTCAKDYASSWRLALIALEPSLVFPDYAMRGGDDGAERVGGLFSPLDRLSAEPHSDWESFSFKK
jgi:hypothetical protein